MRDRDDNLEGAISESVRASQIIIMALVTSPLMLAVILVAFIVDKDKAPENGLMATLGLVAGLLALVAQSAVSRAVGAAGVRGWAKRGGENLAELAQVHQVKMIVAAAICEGAAFLNIIFYGFLDSSPWLLAMAGLMILATAVKFPTLSGVADWCRTQARLVAENAALKRAK